MINFDFESMFEKTPTFVDVMKQPKPKAQSITLGDDLKNIFEPTIEDKQHIIEDYLKWAYEEGLDTGIFGCHLKYIDHLKEVEHEKLRR